MNFYFFLQLQRLKRGLREQGLSLVTGLFIILLAVAVLTICVLTFIEHAEYGFLFLGIVSVSIVSGGKRNQFFHDIFDRRLYYKIRLIENLVSALPFTLILVLLEYYMLASALVLFSIIFVFKPIKVNWRLIVPTPFSRKPFEQIVGFRRRLILFIFAWLLVYLGISVDNFNLSIVGVCLSILVQMSFYLNPEDRFFVWIYAARVKGFLIEKILHSLFGFLILQAPAIIIIMVCFSEYYFIAGIVAILGILNLFLIILAKYAAFPYEIGVVQIVWILLGLWIPFLLLVILPLLYKQCVTNLKEFYDHN